SIFTLLIPPPPCSPLFPYTTLFRSELSMLIPALVALAVSSNSSRRRLIAAVCLVPLTLFILLAAGRAGWIGACAGVALVLFYARSEEHTSELQSRFDLVCRLLLEKK